MTWLRSIGLVALFDLYESLRTRRAIALLLLYLLTSLGASAVAINALAALQARLGDASAAAAEAWLESEEFVQQIGHLFGDMALARELVRIPPLALFYGWLALSALPILVVLTSSDAIATERASGAVRYVLFRVDRLSWALGKLVGQALLMTVGVALGAVATFALGWVQLEGFAPAETALWMIRLGARACCFGFAYLGLALCASQLARSGSRARWLGLLSLIGVWLAGQVLSVDVVQRQLGVIATALLKLLPASYQLALWNPAAGVRVPAMLALLLLGAGFFWVGYLQFARQDA
jgi:ABC-type transport system involved in multi-copper enzyme maturation permease subunit